MTAKIEYVRSLERVCKLQKDLIKIYTALYKVTNILNGTNYYGR